MADTPLSATAAQSSDLRVVVLTPSRKVLDTQCDDVYFPTLQGILGVLPGHTSLVCQLGTGLIHYTRGNVTSFLTVSGGVAEVFNNTVTMLADVAEDPASIDSARAEKALQRARVRLAGVTAAGEDQLNMERASRAELRALARIEASVGKQNQVRH